MTETGLAIKKGWEVCANYNFGFLTVYGTGSGAKITGDNYENATAALSDTLGRSASLLVLFGNSRAGVSYTNFNDKSKLNRDAELWGVGYWYMLTPKSKVYASWGSSGTTTRPPTASWTART